MSDEQNGNLVNGIINGSASAEESAMDEEFLHDFVAEATEHLEAIESNLLELDESPGESGILHTLFRSFHTIKGLAGFVEERAIQQLAHSTASIRSFRIAKPSRVSHSKASRETWRSPSGWKVSGSKREAMRRANRAAWRCNRWNIWT